MVFLDFTTHVLRSVPEVYGILIIFMKIVSKGVRFGGKAHFGRI